MRTFLFYGCIALAFIFGLLAIVGFALATLKALVFCILCALCGYAAIKIDSDDDYDDRNHV